MATVFEEIVQAVHAQLNEPDLAVGVFRLAQPQRTPLRRIVWVPTSFEARGAAYANPRRSGDFERRVIGAEQWSVECQITGDSFEDAERLRERVLWAVRVVMGGDSRQGGGVWVNQDEQEAQVMLGSVQKVIQRFTWTINVLSPEQDRFVLVGVDTEIVGAATDVVFVPTHATPPSTSGAPDNGELVAEIEQSVTSVDDSSP